MPVFCQRTQLKMAPRPSTKYLYLIAKANIVHACTSIYVKRKKEERRSKANKLIQEEQKKKKTLTKIKQTIQIKNRQSCQFVFVITVCK